MDYSNRTIVHRAFQFIYVACGGKMSIEIRIYHSVIVTKTVKGFFVKCGRCGGNGRYGCTDCSICNKTGVVLLTIPEGWANENVGIVRCERCKGEGYVGTSFCRVCDGVGAAVKIFPRIICNYCSGEGSVGFNNCKVCGGIGSIWIGNIPER